MSKQIACGDTINKLKGCIQLVRLTFLHTGIILRDKLIKAAIMLHSDTCTGVLIVCDVHKRYFRSLLSFVSFRSFRISPGPYSANSLLPSALLYISGDQDHNYCIHNTQTNKICLKKPNSDSRTSLLTQMVKNRTGW